MAARASNKQIDFPPIQIYWFSGEAFTAGVEKQSIDNTMIQVYSAEKTLADCFKYRNKIGMETVLEAFDLYRERESFSTALDEGIHRRTLYTMRDTGILERLERGLYRLADLPPLSNPDLVTVARKIPQAVICLISALHFYNITTQIPHAVSIAVNRGTEPPRLDFPPIQIYWFSGEAFTAGVEKQSIDNTMIQVYSAEKTLADCFKYRNKIGMETVLEAFDLYRERKQHNPRKLIQFLPRRGSAASKTAIEECIGIRASTTAEYCQSRRSPIQ